MSEDSEQIERADDDEMVIVLTYGKLVLLGGTLQAVIDKNPESPYQEEWREIFDSLALQMANSP